MLGTDLGFGIHIIDTGFQREHMAACYAMEDSGRVAIVETGTKDTVPHILQHLQEHDLSPEQVDYVIVTHVHLDHAGGVGLLMQQLPNAKLLVHPKGARHMIDPSKLQAGATAVYGETEFNKTYGDLIAVDQSRVMAMEHESTVTLGQRTLKFLDSPGHANHHFCIHDSASHGFFTGDTFGLAYQELTTDKGPFIIPTTTPVQFDPAALKNSINMLMQAQPDCMYLTHYGKVENVQALGQTLLTQVDELVALALSHQDKNEMEQVSAINQELMDDLLQKLKAHGCDLPEQNQRAVLASDVLLNAKGLSVWLARQAA